MFEVHSNWLSKLIAEKSNQELCELFEEIYRFRAVGVLEGGGLRALEEDISRNITHTPTGEMMRTVENKILFEMARRFANALEAATNEVVVKASEHLDVFLEENAAGHMFTAWYHKGLQEGLQKGAEMVLDASDTEKGE